MILLAHPLEHRCWELVKRGMERDLAAELRWCGNESLIAEAERATDADIAALNEAWAARVSG